MLLILMVIFLVCSVASAEKYRLTDQGVQRLSDGGYIPADNRNKDWRDYQKWLSEGNKPKAKTPAAILVVDEKEDKVKARVRAIAIEQLIKEGILPADYK